MIKGDQRGYESHLVNRLSLNSLDVLNWGREGEGGYFTVLINSLADTRESTLSVLHAFASRGQRFEQKSSEKPKTKSEKKK